MAAPHVTGAVALGLTLYLTATPSLVNEMLRYATKGDVGRTPGGSKTTRTRLSLDLRPFGSQSAGDTSSDELDQPDEPATGRARHRALTSGSVITRRPSMPSAATRRK